jgi:dCTP deaminase
MSSLPLPLAPSATLPLGDDVATPAEARDFGTQFGLLPREKIELMQQRKMVWGQAEIEASQLQPASLDLRLGSRAFRVRASFLPGKERSVNDQLAALKSDEISLEGEGAVLERGCVYVIPLLEHLNLTESFSATANPKSSTGRLDIFTRLITDRSEIFDTVERGYEGPLYAEVSPRSFSVRVRRGSRLNQIRFRRWHPQQFFSRTEFGVDDKDLRERHAKTALVDGELNLRGGLVVRIALSADSPENNFVGFRAQKHADIIDVDRVGVYEVGEFWEPLLERRDKKLILDPGEFYILASQEKLHIPPDLAAEMVPIDPAMGEFRVHYAGFFDPGFGFAPDGRPGSRAVLEVRSHEVPFILEDGQVIGRLVYEKMAAAPQLLYGQAGGSNYQGQGLKLSKHFRM